MPQKLVKMILEDVLNFSGWMPNITPLVSSGLIPLGIVLIGFWGFYFLAKRQYAPNRNESIQMVFVFFVVAFIILTITGVCFRGTGMKLIWPWVANG